MEYRKNKDTEYMGHNQKQNIERLEKHKVNHIGGADRRRRHSRKTVIRMVEHQKHGIKNVETDC